MQREEVSFGAKLIWARLRQHLGVNPDAWPEQSTLAKEIGASTQQVKRFIAELKEWRLIETERLWGRNRSNHYRFPVHKWEVEVSKSIPREVSKLIPPLKNNYIEEENTRIDRILANRLKADRLSKPLTQCTNLKFGRSE